MQALRTPSLMLVCLFVFVSAALLIHVGKGNHEFTSKKDPYDYVQLAKALIRGEGVQVDDNAYVIHPPLFSLLVGSLLPLFPNEGTSGVMVSVLSFIASTFLMYRLSRILLVDSYWAVLCVILFCANTTILDQAVNGRAESLFVFLTMTLACWSLSDATIFRNGLTITTSAILAASLCYVRPEGVYLVLVIVIWSWQVSGRVRVRSLAYWLVVWILLLTPYVVFLKETTGTWQLSGKLYVNLVMGELASPYQDGPGGERYQIIRSVMNDPTQAMDGLRYLIASPDKWIERIPRNVTQLGATLFFTWSALGLLFILLGWWYFPRPARSMMIGLLGLLLFYIGFIVLGRVVAVLHGVFCVFAIFGLQGVTSRCLQPAVVRPWAIVLTLAVALYGSRNTLRIFLEWIV